MNYEKLFSKLLTITMENGYVSSCAESLDFSHVQQIDHNAKVIEVKEKVNDFKELADAIKIFRQEIKDELKLLRTAVNNITGSTNTVVFQSTPDILNKTPYVENSDDFNTFEFNLLNTEFKRKVVSELQRFKGSSLQASLSSMINALLSKDMIKTFCYKGSNGKEASNSKKAFRNTRCYDAIYGNN